MIPVMWNSLKISAQFFMKSSILPFVPLLAFSNLLVSSSLNPRVLARESGWERELATVFN